MICRHVIVRGDVQGVFFRGTCRAEARRRGVVGWVGNRVDGAVEAVFEGEPTAVEAMCAWCRQGPRHAHVESVEITIREVEGELGFEIRW